MTMKKKAAAATKKVAPKKKVAVTKKPTEKAPPPPKAAAKTEPSKPAAPAMETTKRAGTYRPSPVEGMGWAPFRYPPQ